MTINEAHKTVKKIIENGEEICIRVCLFFVVFYAKSGTTNNHIIPNRIDRYVKIYFIMKQASIGCIILKNS